jgi:enamine deaminase RidA (YjgF/YER057c/UK114 family)
MHIIKFFKKEVKMTNDIEKRLTDLNIALPNAAAPAANYVPFVRTGNMLFVSGQVSQDSEGLVVGTLGSDFNMDDGYKAARLCGIALIAQLKLACQNDLSKLKRVVRLGGFVNCTSDFKDHPKIINGASDLMVEVFGEKGAHSRAAVGSVSLPMGVAVEVDGVFELID